MGLRASEGRCSASAVGPRSGPGGQRSACSWGFRRRTTVSGPPGVALHLVGVVYGPPEALYQLIGEVFALEVARVDPLAPCLRAFASISRHDDLGIGFSSINSVRASPCHRRLQPSKRLLPSDKSCAREVSARTSRAVAGRVVKRTAHVRRQRVLRLRVFDAAARGRAAGRVLERAARAPGASPNGPRMTRTAALSKGASVRRWPHIGHRLRRRRGLRPTRRPPAPPTSASAAAASRSRRTHRRPRPNPSR